MASSDTAQVSERSPKSMMPSGCGRSPSGRDTTTLASVRSRCTAWRGSASISGISFDHASAEAVVEAVAVGRVVDVCDERIHDVVAVAEVPLQRAVQAGVPEVGEGEADPAREFAHGGDDRR